MVKVCGESGDVSGDTIESWLERLPELVDGYQKENIWNRDETGVFWKALPDRGFGGRSKNCKGGKKSKQRITVALFASVAGTKEKPVVIWNAKTPRCMKWFDKSVQPVDYRSQKRSWMTTEIMESILTKLNYRLSQNSRYCTSF